MRALIPIFVVAILAACVPCHAQTAAYLVGSSTRLRIFRVDNDQQIGTLRLGLDTQSPAVAPNGRLIYAPSFIGYMSFADATINAELARIPGIMYPPAVTVDGSRIVVAQADLGHNNVPDILIIDALTLTPHTYPLSGLLCNSSTLPLCDTVSNIAIAGNTAYFETAGPVAAGVVGFNLGTLQASLVSGVPSTNQQFNGNNGVLSQEIVATSDGQYLISAQQNPDGVFLISTAQNSVVYSPTLTMMPTATAISTTNAGTLVYVAGADYSTGNPEIQVYSLIAGPSPSLTLLQTAQYPNNLAPPILLAVSTDGSRIYAADSTPDNTLAVLDSTNPASGLPVLEQITLPDTIYGLATANLQTAPSPNAPMLSGLSRNTVINSETAANRTLQISGSNLSSDVQVRFGNAPLVPGAVNGSVSATIPYQTASQAADVIVSNRNPTGSVNDYWASAILHNQLVISGPPSFEPSNQVVVEAVGDDDLVFLNASTVGGVLPSVPEPQPALIGIGITPDGATAYSQNFVAPILQPVDLAHQTALQPIAIFPPNFFRGIGGQEDEVQVVSSNPVTATHGPAAYAVAAKNLNTSCPPCDSFSAFDQVLTVVDADPGTSSNPNSAYNTIVKQFYAGLQTPIYLPGGLASTPDGRYVYTSAQESFILPGWSFYTNSGNLVIYDVATGNVAVTTVQSLNAAGFQGHIEVSPDGNSLLLTASDGGILVFDISSGQQLAPVFRAEIKGSAPSGFSSPVFSSFRIPQGTPGILVAWDQVQNLLETFNFQPTLPDFSQLGTLAIPGATSPRDEFGMDVTPDGKLVYALLLQEDNAAVVDISIPAAPSLLTKILVGLSPSSIAVRPGTATPASSSPTSTVTVSPMPNVSISLAGSTGGSTTVTTTVIPTGSTPPPSGFQLGTIPVYYNIATTAGFSNAVVCFTYDPTQVPSPESSLRLAHYNKNTDPTTGQVIGWEDVTLSGYPNTTTHTICGQVSSLSPFVIGIASPVFVFESLLDDISVLPGSETPTGVMRSLRAKVLAARSAYSRSNNSTAVNQLNALINQLNSISGSQITTGDANNLISETKVLINDLQ